MSVRELRSLAKERGLTNISCLRKAELLEELQSNLETKTHKNHTSHSHTDTHDVNTHPPRLEEEIVMLWRNSLEPVLLKLLKELTAGLHPSIESDRFMHTLCFLWKRYVFASPIAEPSIAAVASFYLVWKVFGMDAELDYSELDLHDLISTCEIWLPSICTILILEQYLTEVTKFTVRPFPKESA